MTFAPGHRDSILGPRFPLNVLSIKRLWPSESVFLHLLKRKIEANLAFVSRRITAQTSPCTHR